MIVVCVLGIIVLGTKVAVFICAKKEYIYYIAF